MDQTPSLPKVRAWLLEGTDLDGAAQELLARWVTDGVSWYVEHRDGPEEERLRAEALERKFLNLTAEHVAVRAARPS